MTFWQFLQQNGPEMLTLLRQHLVLVFISTLIAVSIGVPTGILLTRNRALRSPVLGIANIMQTIPSLALFGFLIPLPFIGGIGPRAAIVAVVVYALLPIIRNTVTGILGVDQNVREAAVAMGMTNGQILWQVELPLAMSVILTGVRVATVISVGVTTIAAAVGAGGLGVYIFRGLRQYDNNLLLAGAVPAALMALEADFLLGSLEKHFSVEGKSGGVRGSLTLQRMALALSAPEQIAEVIAMIAVTLRRIGLALSAIVIAALILASWFSAKRATETPGVGPPVVVASKDFTESALLAEIVGQMLEARGIGVERHFELGGNLPHEGLVAGGIDLYPEYTGTAYTAILHHPPITDPQAVYDQVKTEYG